MTDNSSPRRERGTALLVWLIVLTLLTLWALYRGVAQYIDWIDHGRSSWYQEWQFLVPLALTIIQGLGIVALWLWYRWGLYLFIGGYALGVILILLQGLSLGWSLVGLVGVGVLYALVDSRRDQFR